MKVLVSLAGLGRLLGVKVESVALPAGSGWGDAADGERVALIVYCEEGPGAGRPSATMVEYREPQACAACKSALVAMCPECSLIPAESRTP